MQDPEDRSGGPRQRSLLSLAPKEPKPAATSHPAGGTEPPPFVRHQMARARREATPEPRIDHRPKAANSLIRLGGDDLDAETPTIPPAAGEAAAKPARLNDLFDSLRARLPWNASGEPAKEVHEAGSQAATLAEAPAPLPPEEPAVVEPVPAREPIGRATAKRNNGLPQTVIEEEEEPVAANSQYWQPLIDPARVVAGVMRSKRLIAVCTVIGALLGVYVAISTPKKYESSAEVLVDPRNLNITAQSLTDAGLSTEATLAIVENQTRVITSSNALDKVVDELHLTTDPEFNGAGAGGIGAFVADLRALLSGGGKKEGDVKRLLAAQKLSDSLDVQREGKTFIVRVTAKTNDPQKSALIANTVVKVFEQTSSQLQEKTATRAADELTSRLAELRSGVEQAERKVESFRASHDLVDAQGKLISDDRIVRLNDQLSAATARVAELSARAATAKSVNVDSVLDGSLPEQVNSQLMAQLRSQYSALKQQSDRLSARLGPRHPERQAIEAQLAGARAQIQAELNRIVASIKIDLKRAQDLQKNLADQLADMKKKHATINNDLVTLRELERDAKAKRDVYESYLLRARQTDEQKDISTANISVISTAFPPLQPEGPSRAVISMIGAFLGLLLGVGIGAGRGAWASLQDNVGPASERKRKSKKTTKMQFRRNEPVTVPARLAKGDTGQRTGEISSPNDEETSRQGAGLSTIEEVRESLREFRKAVRELAESHAQDRPKT